MKQKTCLLCCLCFFLMFIIALMSFLMYGRVVNKLSKPMDPADVDEEKVLRRFQLSADEVNNIPNIKKAIELINNRQDVYNYNNTDLLDKNNTTVLVIFVHDNKTYLLALLESLHRNLELGQALIIFAHDYYDAAINSAVQSLSYARVMQIFYPYSTQLHPDMYPGDDTRFYEDSNRFIYSKKRDPTLVQTKLFWWWTVNQVFDYVRILQTYESYIFFLETEFYMATDCIYMAKILMKMQPSFCPECKFLSLGSWSPSPEMYYPENSHLVLSEWGWSNYSNSGFGFNRTTWTEIQGRAEHFCSFKDSSWENSLKYLISQTDEGNIHMLSTEGPRFFPLSGCGVFKNGTDCDFNVVYHDVLKFIARTLHGRQAEVFKLKFDGHPESERGVEPRGLWGDARDVDLCMSLSDEKRQSYTSTEVAKLCGHRSASRS